MPEYNWNILSFPLCFEKAVLGVDCNSRPSPESPGEGSIALDSRVKLLLRACRYCHRLMQPLRSRHQTTCQARIANTPLPCQRPCKNTQVSIPYIFLLLNVLNEPSYNDVAFGRASRPPAGRATASLPAEAGTFRQHFQLSSCQVRPCGVAHFQRIASLRRCWGRMI